MEDPYQAICPLTWCKFFSLNKPFCKISLLRLSNIWEVIQNIAKKRLIGALFFIYFNLITAIIFQLLTRWISQSILYFSNTALDCKIIWMMKLDIFESGLFEIFTDLKF